MPVRELKLSLDLSALREAFGATTEQLPDDATDEQVNAFLAGAQEGADKAKQPTEIKVPEAKKDDVKPPEDKAAQHPPRQAPGGGLVVDAEMWAETQKELAVVRGEREARERREDQEFVMAAVRCGKFPGSRADHYMTLMNADRDGTREFITNLPEGLPVTEMGTLGSLEDALKASDYPEVWLTPGERRRVKAASKAYADGLVGDVEPGSIIREA